MSKRKCGCVYADARNTPSVKSGHEMGGYLKQPCPAHTPKPATPAGVSRPDGQTFSQQTPPPPGDPRE